MKGLVYNEFEKIIRQWRFVIVLSVYTLLALTIAFSIDKGTATDFTAASTAFQWVTGGFAGVLIPFIICILIGDSIAGEYSSGTIKLLLIRPITRRKIWLSKYIAAVSASLVTVFYLGLCTYICLGFSIGWGSWTAHPPAEVRTDCGSVWGLTWRAYALESLAVTALVSFIFLISSVIRNGVAAVGTAAAAVLLGMMVTNNTEKSGWVSILLFPHLQIADHLVKIFPIPECSLYQSVTALCAWGVCCALAGIWFFQHRDMTE